MIYSLFKSSVAYFQKILGSLNHLHTLVCETQSLNRNSFLSSWKSECKRNFLRNDLSYSYAILFLDMRKAFAEFLTHGSFQFIQCPWVSLSLSNSPRLVPGKKKIIWETWGYFHLPVHLHYMHSKIIIWRSNGQARFSPDVKIEF
jgi:hypothetical protein